MFRISWAAILYAVAGFGSVTFSKGLPAHHIARHLQVRGARTGYPIAALFEIAVALGFPADRSSCDHIAGIGAAVVFVAVPVVTVFADLHHSVPA